MTTTRRSLLKAGALSSLAPFIPVRKAAVVEPEERFCGPREKMVLSGAGSKWTRYLEMGISGPWYPARDLPTALSMAAKGASSVAILSWEGGAHERFYIFEEDEAPELVLATLPISLGNGRGVDQVEFSLTSGFCQRVDGVMVHGYEYRGYKLESTDAVQP
jgi:hypothetical protein